MSDSIVPNSAEDNRSNRQVSLRQLGEQLMPQQAFCSALELVINKALNLTLNGQEPLNKLEQKTLAITLAELGFTLCFTVSNSKVLVTTLVERADCDIVTSLQTLRQLKKEQQLTELIKQEKLDMNGDIKIAQQFVNIAETLDIDWQSEVAKHIGDIATHKLGQLFTNLKNKVQFANQQVQADASEWLVHEKRLVVTRSQIDDFNHQVSEVSSTVITLENRLNQLLLQFSANTQG